MDHSWLILGPEELKTVQYDCVNSVIEPGKDQEGGRARACRASWDMLRKSNTGNFREKDKTSGSVDKTLVIRPGL